MDSLQLLTWTVEVADCPRVITAIDAGIIQVTHTEINADIKEFGGSSGTNFNVKLICNRAERFGAKKVFI